MIDDDGKLIDGKFEDEKSINLSKCSKKYSHLVREKSRRHKKNEVSAENLGELSEKLRKRSKVVGRTTAVSRQNHFKPSQSCTEENQNGQVSRITMETSKKQQRSTQN